jgi:ABC-2 type transport system ATP-binding protein
MPPTMGVARIGGENVAADPVGVKRKIGYLPENVPLYGEMTVRSFLAYAAEVKGVVRKARSAEVGRVVERCGLDGVQRRAISVLSKGYRQRVGLAQALIGSPPVLILDEPTVGLDPRQIIEIREVIKSLAGEHTVLLSSHILPEVAMTCRRALIIHEGRVVADEDLTALNQGGPQAIEVQVEGTSEKVRAALEPLAEIEQIRSEGGSNYVLTGNTSPAVCAAAASLLVNAGLPVQKLMPRERSLEDVFLSAISAEQTSRKEPAA